MEEEELLIYREEKHQEIIEAILSIPKEASNSILKLIETISKNNESVKEFVLKTVQNDPSKLLDDVRVLFSELTKSNNDFCQELAKLSNDYNKEKKVVIKVTQRDQRGFISEVTGTIS